MSIVAEEGETVETINGVRVVRPDPGGLAQEAARGPITIGPEITAGAYLAWVGAMPAGDEGPPLHRHPHTDEGFYIATGELTFQVGDREIVAGAGSFVFVPRGVVHTAYNSGAGPMQGLLILSPGDAEHIFEPADTD